MKLLLDTHVLLWARSDSGRLSTAVREALTDPANQAIVSVVSLTEIAIKSSRGKLDIDDTFFDSIGQLGADVEPFGLEHVKLLARLPWIHRDPFDRMLIAQALVDGATLLTVDERIRQYAVPTLS